MLLHDRDNNGLLLRKNLPGHSPPRQVRDMGVGLAAAQGKPQITAFRILNDDMRPQQPQAFFQRFENLRQGRAQRYPFGKASGNIAQGIQKRSGRRGEHGGTREILQKCKK